MSQSGEFEMIKVKNSITEKDCIAYINKRYLFYCIAGIVFGFLLIGFICLRFLLSLKIWQKGMLDAFALTSMIFALMMPAIYFFTRRGLMSGINMRRGKSTIVSKMII